MRGVGTKRTGIAAVLLLTAAVCRAEAPAIDHPWPPDPKQYDPPGTEVAPGLKVGDTLGRDNADKAKDLLPPEILAHFQQGEYEHPIASMPNGIYYHEKSFDDGTKANAGRFELSKDGAVVDKATGKAPDDIHGLPFPTLDPADPSAGLKAVWNQFHNYWNQGSYDFNTQIVWVSPGGMDRSSTQSVIFAYYENQGPAHQLPNPQGFEWQSITNALDPADLQGTASLNYRYKDPTKRDSLWTYVPALRRVRAVSPSNRADGFLGSDLSQDDGHFFDAKPEDFEWKTIGLRDGLRFAEDSSLRGEAGSPIYVESTGGWRPVWDKDVKGAGFQKPGWKGVAWAPVSNDLVKRKMWVVEAKPKDQYYLYGRIELWIDAETFTGAWARKFSWKNELLNVYQVAQYLQYPATRDGIPEVEWLWGNQSAWQCAENIPAHRATLAGLRADPKGLFDRRVKMDPSRTFDLEALTRSGK
jgi:hypothetical protein